MSARRSSRERKKPQSIYADTAVPTEVETAKQRKRLTAKRDEDAESMDEDDRGEEVTNVVDDEEDEDEAEEEEELVRPAKRRKGKTTSKPPAGAGSKKSAASSRKGAKPRVGRGGKKAEAAKEALKDLDEGTRSLLYESVVRKLPTQVLMEKWVEEFDDKSHAARADIVNFVLWSAGAKKQYASREEGEMPEVGEPEWDELMNHVVEDLREAGISAYPLHVEASRNKTQRFRQTYSAVWHDLARTCREGSGHNLDALRCVIEVLRALCMLPLVSIRHTATYGGLQLGSALVNETLELAKKDGVANRQLEAEQAKGAGHSRKAQDLQRSIEQLAGGVAAMENVLEEVFNGIFAQRYRDVNERVRVDCMEGLGFFLEQYPSMFLKDSFIKYLGWMLYDKAAAVRTAAAHLLCQLYDKPENHARLENFTARFLKRLQDLIHDVDSTVQLHAIRIVRRLQAAGYLDEASQEVLDEVDEKLLDPKCDESIREEAMLFFTDHVEGFNSPATDEQDGAASSSKGKKTKKKQQQQAREGVVERLVTVVHLLEYHLGDSYTLCDELIETCVDSFMRHPEGDFLFDWPTYFELLHEDKRVQRLSESEHSIFVRVLAASVKIASHATTDQDKKSKAHQDDGLQARLQAAHEAYTTGAVEELPKLITQFQTDQDKIGSLVVLPQYLQRDTIENKRNKGSFDSLLRLLRDIYVKSTDQTVLTNVATSLAHLLQNDVQRQHNVAAVIDGLLKDLLRRLDRVIKGNHESPSRSQPSRTSKRFSPLSQEMDLDCDFLAGLTLMQLKCLERQVDLNDYTDVEALTAMIETTMQGQLDISTWSTKQERLESTERVLREGLELLFLVVARSTVRLIQLTRDQCRAKDKAKEEPEAEEGEEEAEDHAELVADAEALVKHRQLLLRVLEAVLHFGAQNAASEGDGNGDYPEVVMETAQKLKKLAYRLASDMRFIFRSVFEEYQILHRLVWSPETEFLRTLQAYFQREESSLGLEDRYGLPRVALQARHAIKDLLLRVRTTSDDAKQEAVMRDLLDPLMRSVLYTTENINRRQAAAIAAHFVDPGKHSTESVKYLMKKLKDFDMKVYLEVQMSTLRTCYNRWAATPGDEAEKEKFTSLAHRMAQTLGVGKLMTSQESFVKFMKTGLSFALDSPPNNLSFLDGLKCYVSKLPENRKRELRAFLEDRVASIPEDVLPAAEEGEDASAEAQAISIFLSELDGSPTAKRALKRPSRPSGRGGGGGKRRRTKAGGGGAAKARGGRRRRSRALAETDDEEDDDDEDEDEEDEGQADEEQEEIEEDDAAEGPQGQQSQRTQEEEPVAEQARHRQPVSKGLKQRSAARSVSNAGSARSFSSRLAAIDEDVDEYSEEERATGEQHGEEQGPSPPKKHRLSQASPHHAESGNESDFDNDIFGDLTSAAPANTKKRKTQ